MTKGGHVKIIILIILTTIFIFSSCGDDTNNEESPNNENITCEGITCSDNGKCEIENNKTVCKCDIGYNGDNCESNIDDCKINPCQNNGVCEDKINGYTCNCSDDFTGVNCETEVNTCNSECEEWENCENKECVLKQGRCFDDNNCSNGNLCDNTHVCVVDNNDYGFINQTATGEVRNTPITFISGGTKVYPDMTQIRLYNKDINSCEESINVDPKTEYVEFYITHGVGVYDDLLITLVSYFPNEEYQYQSASGHGVVKIIKYDTEIMEVEGKVNLEITSGNYFNGNFSFTMCVE